MTISDKLTTIAENEQKVYNAGYDKMLDTFWDVLQVNGQRTVYQRVLKSGMSSWIPSGYTPVYNDFKFTPKYSLENVTDVSYMAETIYGVTSVGELIMPICTNCSFCFNNCYDLENIDAFIAPKATTNGNIFNYCKKLKRIGRLDLSSRNGTGYIVYSCSALEEINFEGTINNSISFQWCTKLTHDSLMSIINALKDYSEDTSGTTYTLTLATDNLAKLTDGEKAIAIGKGWNLA